jgi:Flp pilus assembly protein TadG
MQMRPSPRRRGAATVELALLAPVLAFLFVVAVDYARVFYYSVTVASCARNGALYASDPVTAAESPYASVEEAALADAGNLSPTPTVTSATGTDATGATFVEVTVTYRFQTVVKYPGVPQATDLTRTVRMRLSPSVPN